MARLVRATCRRTTLDQAVRTRRAMTGEGKTGSCPIPR
jgi:hypothetical protein